MTTKQEIMGQLDELEINYNPSDKKADLEALLPVEEEPKVEEPKVEEPKAEEPVVEEPKVKDLYAGKKIGVTSIYQSQHVVVNGKDVIKIHLNDGTATILSEEDLKKQIKK